MKGMSRRRFLAASALGLASSKARAAVGIAVPTIDRLCRIVVGFPPGGSTDVIARRIGERMRGSFAPSFVVDNKPGAGGRIALEHLRLSEGDGTVMVLTPHPMITVYPHLYRKLSYDPLRDFTPVTSVCNTVQALSIGSAVPDTIHTVADFIKWCQANPDQATYGTAGPGTTPHFIGQMFGRAAGIRYAHVPFGGNAPVIQALIGGHVASGFSALTEALPQHRGRKLRILATTGTARSRFVPDVPVLNESGVQLPDTPIEWFGIFVSAKTPPPLVVELNAAIRGAVGAVEFQSGLAEMALDATGESPEAFARLVVADHGQWGRIVRASGFTIDE